MSNITQNKTTSSISKNPSQTKNFRVDLQIIRALAIIMVLGYHFGVPHMHGGSFGVEIFFVLSGFLITSGLLTYGTSAQGLKTFYVKRLARTVPAALVTILVTSALALLFLPNLAAQMYPSALAAATWSEGWRIWASESGIWDSGPILTPFTHFWSLGAEEHFYILMPLVLMGFWFLWVKGLKKTVLVFASFFSVVIFTWSFLKYADFPNTQHLFAYFAFPGRIWQLGLGVFAALAVWAMGRFCSLKQIQKISKTWILAVLFFTGVVVYTLIYGSYDKATDSPLWAFFITLSTAFVIVTGASRLSHSLDSHTSTSHFLTGFFSPFTRFLVWVGTISYGLYLWHMPLIWFKTNLGLHTPNIWLDGLILITLSTALAALSWKYVETPFIKKARKSKTS